MNGPQGIKSTLILEAVTASTGDTITSSRLDTKGYSYARIVVHASTQATNKSPAAFTLVEGDASDTNTAAITGCVAGTDYTIPAPASATDGKPYFEFDVDLRGRKRYLTLVITPASTQTYSAQADLYRGQEAPNNTTARNVKGFCAV